MGDEEVTNVRLSIKESLKKLEEYDIYLRSRLSDIKSTKDGVRCSLDKAREEVALKFAAIQDEVLQCLDSRQKEILHAIGDIERKDLEPLGNLEEKINSDLENVLRLAAEGNTCLEKEDSVLLAEAEKVKSELVVHPTRYPDIPCLSHTLSVSFGDTTQPLIDIVKLIGEVSMTGSLQIVDMTEQPGGMLVQWDDETFSDNESFTDYSGIQEYMLQYCRTLDRGNNEAAAVFSTVYSGEEMSHIVTDLEPHVSYTFRVCGRFGKDGKWSSWSIPRKGITTLEPHEWSTEDCVNANKLIVYQLSNDRRTATKVFPDSSKLLRSRTMSYRIDTSLKFTIAETGDPSNGDGLGLTTSHFDFSNPKQSLQCSGCTSINSKGLVYVNGSCMKTRLPPFKRGSVVALEASKLSPGKLRVSISVDDKQVTFDWQLQEKDDCTKLFFAMGFQHSGWQVSVGN
ncbi:predicted protein [Nematostella vectensis]|uniref:Fibronectin type-III domain-containing protein n=2 Tax=Nematostella vectensis TaxID=45351 RepID=A7SH50_NEMVE|nr:predicted protein [Nematostella vectensis]|eukprot:XP_001629022.1 predicted protein [Nematostella vectensis]